MTMHSWRRASAAASVILASALVLSGCANTDDPDNVDESEDNTTESLLPPAEGNTEYPLTLTTWLGETVLEERPERVAVIGFSPNFDALQVLDVTPVYTIADDVEGAYRDAEWFSQIEFVDTAHRGDPINFEGIAATDPDVIVAVNSLYEAEDYERLSEIAPVIENPEEIAGDQVEWQETQRLIGEALDLSDASEQVVTEAEEAIAATAADHPEFEGNTITIAYNYGPEYGTEYYTVAGGTAESILGLLGFEPNPLAEEFVNDATVSDENQSHLDADVLMMFYADDEVRETHESMPLFQDVSAVAEGRYVSLTFNDESDLVAADGTVYPNTVWVLRRGASAASLPWAVDIIASQLSEIEIS